MASAVSRQKVINYLREAGLGEGDQLPAEVDLAKVLGMSRNSIREAYAGLTASGILIRRHGFGTFVARVPILNDFGHQGFWRMIEKSGYVPSVQMVSEGEAAPDDELASEIEAPGKGPVTRIERLFFAGDKPVIFIQQVMAHTLRTNGIDWTAKPNLLDALADQLNLDGAEHEIIDHAVNASPAIARFLQVPAGTALMHGISKVHIRSGYVPIVSQHWSNPEYFMIVRRGPIIQEQLLN